MLVYALNKDGKTGSRRKKAYTPEQRTELLLLALKLPDWTEEQRRLQRYVRRIMPRADGFDESHRAYAILEAAESRGEPFEETREFLARNNGYRKNNIQKPYQFALF